MRFVLAALAVPALLVLSGAARAAPACPSGQASCDTSCAELHTDPRHCGSCGRTCDGPCVNGTCHRLVQVAVGTGRTCALDQDGSVYCWGFDQPNFSPSPPAETCGDVRCRQHPTRVPRLQGVQQLALGGTHGCALHRSTSVLCWGSNAYGELGNGAPGASAVPDPVAVSGLSDVLQVDVSRYCNHANCGHTCAVVVGGGVKCWGANYYGALGNGTRDWSGVPVPVTGLTFAVQVVTGDSHACSLHSNGTVNCWGRADQGQLGSRPASRCDGPSCALVPTAVPGLTGVVQLAAGAGHTCARKRDGSVVCWGGLPGGEVVSPTVVEGVTGATALAAGYATTCAVTGAGRVRCWGMNNHGQLGDRSMVPRPWPVDAFGIVNAVDVAVGGYTPGGVTPGESVCALDAAGSAWCWGANEVGQLGVGNAVRATVPTPLSWQDVGPVPR